MPHLIAALEAEIGQQTDTAAWIWLDDEGDDWPKDYDPNDLPLFEGILRMLEEAYAQHVEAIKLRGKSLSFMVLPMHEYLRTNGPALTFEERQALTDLLDRHSALQEQIGQSIRSGSRVRF